MQTGRTRRGWAGWLRRVGDQLLGPPDPTPVVVVGDESDLVARMWGPRGMVGFYVTSDDFSFPMVMIRPGTAGCEARWIWGGDSANDKNHWIRVPDPGDAFFSEGPVVFPLQSAELDFVCTSTILGGVGTVEPAPAPYSSFIAGVGGVVTPPCVHRGFHNLLGIRGLEPDYTPWEWIGPGMVVIMWGVTVQDVDFQIEVREPGSSPG